MLGAVVLGVLALAGASNPLWVSDQAPRANSSYRALTWSGKGELSCGATIDRQPAKTSVREIDGKSVCRVWIPKGTAGRTLRISVSVTARQGAGYVHGSGAVRPKTIRR